MIGTNDMTPLGYKILEHWKHRPAMVPSLVQGNRLQQSEFAAQEIDDQTSCTN